MNGQAMALIYQLQKAGDKAYLRQMLTADGNVVFTVVGFEMPPHHRILPNEDLLGFRATSTAVDACEEAELIAPYITIDGWPCWVLTRRGREFDKYKGIMIGTWSIH